ncbi:MAG: hypothetical protein Q7T18_12365 [Sedimentisphaerales bacterium]|nr:hypothetical protein [Sedimentisphaerales bacterium]
MSKKKKHRFVLNLPEKDLSDFRKTEHFKESPSLTEAIRLVIREKSKSERTLKLLAKSST